MKIFIFTFSIVVFSALQGFAQKGGHAAKSATAAPAPTAAAGSASSGSGSGSSQLIQGYHYRLPKKYHVRYKQITAGDAVQPIAGQPLKVNYTDRKITFDQSKRSLLAKIPKDAQILPKDIVAYNAKLFSVPGQHLDGTRTDFRDTLSRYSDTACWVSITQLDTGRLMVQFYARVARLNQGQTEASANKAGKVNFTRFSDGTIDAAIPISAKDSAQNFYLQVKPKNTIADPLYYISLPYYVWQYGATTIPFRYRFGTSKKTITLTDNTKTPPAAANYPVPAEATANISLAAYIGYKFGGTRFYNDATKSHNTVSGMFSFFGGPTLVPLSANNVSTGTDLNQYPSQLFAWSGGVSFTAEFGALNLGFFGGIDVPLQHSTWVYADRPWIGFGIGFNLGMLTSAGDFGQ